VVKNVPECSKWHSDGREGIDGTPVLIVKVVDSLAESIENAHFNHSDALGQLRVDESALMPILRQKAPRRDK
jgi:hypothetical protein